MSRVSTMELFNRAQQGDMDSLVEYALRLMDGVDCQQDTEAALQCLSVASKRGCGKADTQLGICFAYGIGVKQDDVKSTECFQNGAQKGDPEAMYRLFQNKSVGTGCSVNLLEADRWLNKAAAAGSEKAATTSKKLSNSRLMASDIQERAQSAEMYQEQENKLALSVGERLNPAKSFGQLVKGEEEITVNNEDYNDSDVSGSTALLITIYLIFGLLSGGLCAKAINGGASAFYASDIFKYISSAQGVMIYLCILGGVVGFLSGFVMSKVFLYGTPYRIFYYFPMLAIPIVLMMIGPGLMAVLSGLVSLVITIVSGLAGIITVIGVCSACSGG